LPLITSILSVFFLLIAFLLKPANYPFVFPAVPTALRGRLVLAAARLLFWLAPLLALATFADFIASAVRWRLSRGLVVAGLISMLVLGFIAWLMTCDFG
jgi:hypothetical protein